METQKKCSSAAFGEEAYGQAHLQIIQSYVESSVKKENMRPLALRLIRVIYFVAGDTANEIKDNLARDMVRLLNDNSKLTQAFPLDNC